MSKTVCLTLLILSFSFSTHAMQNVHHTKHEYQLYCAVRALANVVLQHKNVQAVDDLHSGEFRYKQLLAPNTDKTCYIEYISPNDEYSLDTTDYLADGVMVEWDNGMPRLLWTPWGKWRFAGDVRNTQFKQTISNNFLKKVKTELHKNGDNPVYKVCEFNGTQFPTVKEEKESKLFVFTKLAKQQLEEKKERAIKLKKIRLKTKWKHMTAKYHNRTKLYGYRW